MLHVSHVQPYDCLPKVTHPATSSPLSLSPDFRSTPAAARANPASNHSSTDCDLELLSRPPSAAADLQRRAIRSPPSPTLLLLLRDGSTPPTEDANFFSHRVRLLSDRVFRLIHLASSALLRSLLPTDFSGWVSSARLACAVSLLCSQDSALRSTDMSAVPISSLPPRKSFAQARLCFVGTISSQC